MVEFSIFTYEVENDATNHVLQLEGISYIN